jgi:hypothetical protein
MPCRFGPTRSTTSDTPAISGDGRFVGSSPDDKDLVPGGTDKFFRVPARPPDGRHDPHLDQDQRNQASDDSDRPSLSNDGRYIAL